MIYLGADHRGFQLKEYLKKRLTEDNIPFEDKGNSMLDSQDDYVDFAKFVATDVLTDLNHKGVLICGSGAGVDMVANKIEGIRCALVQDIRRAEQARQHEDANVLALPADVLDREMGYQIVKTFLTTAFSGDARHVRRIEKIHQVEKEQHKVK